MAREYYHHWLAALENLVTAKGLTDVAALFERREAWADAYRHTPHGQPVQLRPGISHQLRLPAKSTPASDARGRRREGNQDSRWPFVHLQRLLLRAC